jgi:hypothetical protein
MSKRQKVKVRKIYKKTRLFLQELGDGAAYALKH